MSKASEEHKGLPVEPFASKAKWRTWLRRNHNKSQGVWLKFAKKGSGVATVTYEEAREQAIIFGWIDGLINSYDESYYLLRFTPRRPRSKWSKINRAIAEQLIRDGLIQPSGLAEVEAAKKDGRWAAAYDPPSKITPHPDLKKALKASPKAEKAFAAASRANRYAIMYGVSDAKREDTRARRIAKFINMLERGEVPHPDR